MTITQVAAVLIRLSAITWIVLAIFGLTALPVDIWEVTHPHASYFSSLYNIGTAMRLLGIVMHVGVGIAYWVFALPFAKFVSRGL
jgi:hypothetical protein